MAAITTLPSGRLALLTAGLDAPIRVALLRDTYTPSDAHDRWADAQDHEVVGPGYVAGGVLWTPSAALVGADAALSIASPVTWPGALFSAKYAMLLLPQDGETISGAVLIGYSDLNPGGDAISVRTGTFQVNFADNALLIVR